MDLIFLQAALPLTKTIVGTTVAPYPNVVRLTSHNEKINTIDDFFRVIRLHADRGHCLFNGRLKSPLKHESRAGRTLSGVPREWLVFDFDKVRCDNVADLLPACAKDVSYILQRSASMFVDDSRFSGHVFMLLDKPITQEQLKQWFETLNFQSPLLKSQLALTGSKTSLHWPLDRSAAYDSKLIYIAPPKLIGVQPLIQPDEAIQLVKRKKPFLSIPSFEPVPRGTINETINALREVEHLEPHSLKTKPYLDGELLDDADKQLISNVKNIGEHYIKFNLGNGDSMGYWIDLRTPHVIRNFKGEPYMLTKEVDPEFYKALAKQAPRIVTVDPLDEGAEILAFFATNNESEVTIGIWYPLTHFLELNKSSLAGAAAWLAGFGVMKPGHHEHFKMVFDPTDIVQYYSGSHFVNKFRASEYMMQPKGPKPSTVKEIPPLMLKILLSILGDQDGTLLPSFINWLAYIFQTRKKAETAWVLHGIPGTGKGKFVQHVLKPLFGKELVEDTTFSVVQTPFNAWMDNKLFVILEESSIAAVENQSDLMMKLKHWITDSDIEIHAKNKNAYSKPNFTNFIFHSNERNAVVLSDKDRRFNIAHRQETKLYFTPNEYLALARGDDLKAFADVLHRWPVNEEAVRTVVTTVDTQALHEQTTPIGQQIAEAILRGDTQYFIDRQPSETEAMGDFGQKYNTLGEYTRFIDQAIAGKKRVTSSDDLYILFRTLIPDPRYFQEGKLWRSRYLTGLGLNTMPQWDPTLKKATRGIAINWQKPTTKPEVVQASSAKVVNLPKRGAL
jgi:Family of unknown function (DUF5906)